MKKIIETAVINGARTVLFTVCVHSPCIKRISKPHLNPGLGYFIKFIDCGILEVFDALFLQHLFSMKFFLLALSCGTKNPKLIMRMGEK